MDVRDKTVVVTGAASGIGRALARRFATEGAAHVVAADRDHDGARAVAEELGASVASAASTDVSREADIATLIEHTETTIGPIDLFCSNAGVLAIGGVEQPDEEWRRSLDVNVMAHVWAARHLVPRMLERGHGHLLNTASAAGLLIQIGSAPYTVTKHAAVGFAEWLSVTYGEQGLGVSVVCPQAVETKMTAGIEGGGVAGVDGMLSPEAVADAVIEGLAAERFLILPHPEVAEYERRKVADRDRWITGMRRLQARFSDMFR
jgi:NAD(P)-dependent dehydrogenase (short-subunit alcohol dehydrogenase family)